MRKRSLLLLWVVFTLSYSCNFKSELKNEEENEEIREGNEEHEDGMEQWMEQHRIMTMDPALGYAPSERADAARQYAQSLINNPSVRTNALSWSERGPNNVGGRVRAFIIDKNDATGNTAFAGGVGGGIWKCTNFKSSNYSWTLIGGTTMSNLAISCLVQDPTTPATMYAGTGEGWFNSSSIMGNGIYKSTDGGLTWNVLAATSGSYDFNYVQDIAITNTGILFATTRSRYCNNGGGIQRSTNGGTTWTRVLGTTGTDCTTPRDLFAADLEIASNGDLYATTGLSGDTEAYRGKLYKSAATNGANIGTTGTWIEITPPAIATSSTWRRIEIALAPNDANIIYALCQKRAASSIGAIFKSSDAGITWVQQSNPSWCSQGSSSSDFTNGQAWYDLIAAVDPNNSSICFIGGVDVLKTVDGGGSWSQVTQWSSGCSALPFIHADNHNLVFINGSSNDLVACNDGGVFYSADGGTTWSARTTGLNVTQFYCVDYHPTITDFFIAGAQDNGTHKLTSAGLGSSVKVTGGDGGFCHIDQTDGTIQMASYVYNVHYYSKNGGTTFGTVSGSTQSTGWFINPTEYDDALDALYSSAAAGTYGLVTGLSGTGVPSYAAVTLTDLGTRRVSAIKVDPNVANGGTIWMAGYLSGSAPVFIKISNANTSSPTLIKSVIPTTFTSGSWVNSIDVENGNPNHLLATCTSYGVNQVMESTDGGTTWSTIDGNLPDMPVYWGIFAPSDGLVTSATTGGGIILGTEVGVWGTSVVNATATSWTPQSTGLGSVSTQMIKYRASDRLLVAATHGRGIFTATLPSVSTGVNPTVNTKGFINNIYANNNNLYINTGNLTGINNITVNIVDMQGRLIKSQKANYSAQNISINSLPKGAYVVKIYGTKKEQYVQQFVK